jgi:hypothetical protein
VIGGEYFAAIVDLPVIGSQFHKIVGNGMGRHGESVIFDDKFYYNQSHLTC